MSKQSIFILIRIFAAVPKKLFYGLTGYILITFLFLPTSSFCASTLSFDQARTMLRENNSSLKAAQANTESKKLEAESLKFLHGPTVSVEAVELWGELKIDLDKSISTPIGKMPVHINENNNVSGPRAAISGTVPIFTGGRIGAAQDIAKFAADEAEAQKNSRLNSLEAELVAKYFGLQLALSLQKLRESTLAEENRELSRAKKFEEQGMISHVEVMGVKVAQDKAERENFQARNNVRTAKLELQRLLVSENIGALSTPLFVLRNPIPPMEKWVELALKNNPQITAINARINQANQGVKLARSDWFPQIMGFGQYYFAKPNQTYIKPEWLAGIGVNFTLWSAKDRLDSFKSAKATSREAKSSRNEADNIIRTATETAWIQTQNAREQYNLTASTVALARENLELKKAGFGEGLYTSLDVTEARNQLLSAEVERRLAAFEFVVNYALLHVLSGTMEDFLSSCSRKDMIIEK